MSLFFSYALPGIPVGCAFALVAVGLVLTYRATGVFNFAFGSEAYAAGVVYAELYSHGVPPWLGALFVVFVIAPIFGAVLDMGLFSRIPAGNTTAKTISALGVMVFLPEIVQTILGPVSIYSPDPPFFGNGRVAQLGSIALSGPEMSTIICTAFVLALLMLILRSRRLGLPIRAAVESPKLLELTGIDSRWVLRSSWMISTSLAGLAGVLLAANTPGTVVTQNFTNVLVVAVAAAAIGGLKNLPVSVIGGVLLGIALNVAQGYLPTNSIWSTALLPSLPFFLLLAMLIFHPALRRLEVVSDPMASVLPPLSAPALAIRPPHIHQTVRRFRWPFLVISFLVATAFTPGIWISALSTGAALSIVFLSITLMTGLAGQLSLAQAAFAGVGAFTTAQLSINEHVPLLVAAVAGAALAGLGGVIASLPALRLRGLPVTILTFCLALLADNLIFPTSWIGGGSQLLFVARPHLFKINMDGVDSKSFFIFVFVVMMIVTGIVHLLLRGTTGRALAASHASAAGALSSGVPVRRFTVVLFALSAAIAGLGGALYAMNEQSAIPNAYNWFYGPTYLVIVVTVGVTSVEGAIEAGLGYALLNQLVSYLPSSVGGSGGQAALTILLLSLGAFTYAKHPEGIVEYVKQQVALKVFRARPSVVHVTHSIEHDAHS